MPSVYLVTLLTIAGTGILMAVYFTFKLLREEDDDSKDENVKMKINEIAESIRRGADTYLFLENRNLGVVVFVITFFLGTIFGLNIAACFASGAFCSALTGFIGMRLGVRVNSRVTWAARCGMSKAFSIAYRAGSVMGLLIMAMQILGITLIYHIFQDLVMVSFFSVGASLVAFFAQIGGGIYTKSADIGADLAGKRDQRIPEDDPRNPGVIPDLIGDNVGDNKGRAMDLFDSDVAIYLATALLAAAVGMTIEYVLFPLMLFAVGLLASICSTFVVLQGSNSKNPEEILNRGLLVTCFSFVVFSFLIVYIMGINKGLFWITLTGLIEVIIISFTSDKFTSIKGRIVLEIAKSCVGGPAIVFVVGLAYAAFSIIPSVGGVVGVLIVGRILALHFGLNVFYSIAVSALSLLALSGTIVTNDAFGPIADNASGLASMVKGVDSGVLEVTGRLDAAGNMTKATTKSFATIAAALTVVSLFWSYMGSANLSLVDLSIGKLEVLVGGFIGAIAQLMFMGILLLITQKGAFRVLQEIRRQFDELDLLQGKNKPDYDSCIRISTDYALKGLMLSGFLALTFPLLVRLAFGKSALGGFLAGNMFIGIPLALLASNAGAAWDNAKKLFESQEEKLLETAGLEDPEIYQMAYMASIEADTAGDSFKDVWGPSVNTLLALLSLISNICVLTF